MKLRQIIDEMTGAEQVRDSLINKSDHLKAVQSDLKQKIADQKKKIKKTKETERLRNQKQESKLEEVRQDVSQVLRLANGKVIGYVHTQGNQTRYFNRGMKLVAIEAKQGTFKANGQRVSPDAIGLFILGLNSKKQ